MILRACLLNSAGQHGRLELGIGDEENVEAVNGALGPPVRRSLLLSCGV